MGRLGVVAAPERSWRSWRPFAGPVALLLVVTLVVAVVRASMHDGGSTSKPRRPAPAAHRPAAKRAQAPHHVVYVVRAGDTITSIAARTGISTATLLRLNPKATPTALFIGQRLRLR